MSFVSQNSSIGIAMGYRLNGWRSIPNRDKILFSFPQNPDRLWDQPSLLTDG
jgi:hypothetical protein